jgi:hypothetical protein
LFLFYGFQCSSSLLLFCEKTLHCYLALLFTASDGESVCLSDIFPKSQGSHIFRTTSLRSLRD